MDGPEGIPYGVVVVVGEAAGSLDSLSVGKARISSTCVVRDARKLKRMVHRSVKDAAIGLIACHYDLAKSRIPRAVACLLDFRKIPIRKNLLRVDSSVLSSMLTNDVPTRACTIHRALSKRDKAAGRGGIRTGCKLPG